MNTNTQTGDIHVWFTNGGELQVLDDQLVIRDHNGVPCAISDFGSGDLLRCLDFARPNAAGLNLVQTGNAVLVIAWASDRDGGAYLYVHTADRTQALAPLYLTARERRDLHRQIGG